MGRIKSIHQIQHGRDAMKIGERNDWKFKAGGKHFVGKHPDFPGNLAIPNKDLSRGVKNVIVKAFLSVGMTMLVLGLLYLYYM